MRAERAGSKVHYRRIYSSFVLASLRSYLPMTNRLWYAVAWLCGPQPPNVVLYTVGETRVKVPVSTCSVRTLYFLIFIFSFCTSSCLCIVSSKAIVCACGKPHSVNHCFTCKRGGYAIMRHNFIRDPFAEYLLREICKDV